MWYGVLYYKLKKRTCWFPYS